MKMYIALLFSLLFLGCVSQPVSEQAQATSAVQEPGPETSEVEQVGEDILNISSELGELDISDEELEQLG
ncbi:hypothetical protein HY571_01720 [Candidatus Micrarchaeota archaeon]|nr:hypothetical protein [Candidatus Micrarchaeota archaeon]